MLKLRYIDALRGWAILLIMMTNISLIGSGGYHWLVQSFLTFGNKGIQLFFVISAFTLFLSYNNQKTNDIHSVRNFYLRRLFRIAPMYYLAFAYYFWQKIILCGNYYSPASLLASLTFLNGVSPYWMNGIIPGTPTIVVEMAFYTILPFLALKIKNLNQAFYFTITAYLVAVTLRFFLGINSPIENIRLWEGFLYLNFINQLPAFGLGIIAYFIVIRKDRNFAPVNYLILAFLLIGCRIWDFLIPNSYCYSIGFMMLIYVLSIKEFKCIVNRATTFIGKISYSIFYIHFAVQFWMIKSGVFNLLPSNMYISLIIKFCIILAFTIPISWFTWRYIEEPLRNLGKKLI
jgi:peptidoglycan/LPS O-acetylase OafA/YrhL